ncbi:MAG: preprotein translocase subunit SecE [Deltaproteobacteria bacterium]|jgi:preprotein translocase subunit SecE|nr:preprotein translocase subunit SecE [Deltaproteobacteria bacterium]
MTKHRKNKGQAVLDGTAQAGGAAAAVKIDKSASPPQGRLKSKKDEGEVKPKSWFFRLFQFFKDAKRELARVSWPTRKETVRSTGVLLVLVAISAAYLGLVDSLLSWVLRLLVN